MMDMKDDDQELKEMLLQSLIEKMEEIMGDDMNPKKGMSVEVAAPDKGHLAEGLDKAKDVLQHEPEMPGNPAGMEAEDDDGKSDAERLAELMGDEDDEDDEDKMKR